MRFMGCERVLFGKVRNVPQANGVGSMQDSTRWRVLRDGVERVIVFLPVSERKLATRLGEVWAYLDSRVEGDAGTGGQWASLF